MPNWTENELYITGPQKDRDNFMNDAEGHHSGVDWNNTEYSTVTELDFNSFIPYPQQYKDQDTKAAEHRKIHPRSFDVKDGFNSGGYEWCCKNWGTKWNACDIVRKEGKTSLSYKFSTAWNPPIPVVNAMAWAYPTLTFKLKYFEGGMGFQGVYEIKRANIIKDISKDYHGHRGG